MKMKRLQLLLIWWCSFLPCPQASAGSTDDDNVPQVCVTLHKYHATNCHGGLSSTRNITAWTRPGSPCHHTAAMQDNSVKDQYCGTTETPVFHQTVFVHNKHCHVSLAQKAFSPQKLSYRTNKCTYGYKLVSCVPGPCADVSPNTIHGQSSIVPISALE